MLKKILGLGLVLIFAASAYAQVLQITGIIQDVRPVVYGDRSAVVLSLRGRAETFVVQTADAPKFGLLRPETAAAAHKAKMAKELAAAKGWKVRLAVEPKKDTDAQEYLVHSLEKLP